jgi:hypothetical protein
MCKRTAKAKNFSVRLTTYQKVANLITDPVVISEMSFNISAN